MRTMWYRPDGRLRTPTAPVQWVCSGPITYTGQSALQRDIDNFKAALDGVEVADAFLPVAAPASVESGRINAHYSSEEEYVYALAEALRVEYTTIVDAGLLLQVDDAFIPYNYDRLAVAGMSMDDYKHHCQLRIDALNHALRDIPEDRVRYHICWGSWHGPHSNDVPFKGIVDLVLRVKAQAYLFEAICSRQCSTRARISNLGRSQAARRKDAGSGGCLARDKRAGTPRACRTAAAAVRRPR